MAKQEPQGMRFCNLKKGMCARVTGVTECCEDLFRLQEMGLTVGTEFKVMKIAPFGDPVEIDVRGYRLCLRKNETNSFEIESVS